ncbi:MAG: hypothetical protein HY670_01550 [Chloroflexi bacterium]|nr:hypothetical protein [Chloroflexota bacterium]
MAWVPVKRVPSLMVAEMWEDLFESEGLSAKVLPEGEITTWGERVTFVVYVPKGREHVAEEILRKL